MSMRKFIAGGSALAGPVNIPIPKNRYAGFLVRFTGTTSAGQTLLIGDLGQVRVMRYGQEQISESAAFFAAYNDLKGGFLPGPTGGAAALEDVFFYVPFSLPELPNTANVLSNEEMVLRIEPAATLPARFVALPCQYEVYGYITPDVPEAYQLTIREQDVQAAGAGRLAPTLNGKNLAAMYLIDAGAVIGSYSLDIDKIQVVDNIDDAVERAITSWENQIEAATALAEVNLVRTGNIANAINGIGKLQLVFTGAGTANITLFQIALKRSA